MQTFQSIAGQSIYDVCLNTYGSLDFLFKLIADNNIADLNADILSGQTFTWDETKIVNQAINQSFSYSGKKFCTDVSNNGSVFYVAQGSGAALSQMQNQPANPVPSFPPAVLPRQVTYSTFFVSNADGLTSMTINDVNNNPIYGATILQVIDEIKPLKNSEWSFNSTTAVLSLLLGKTVDNQQTLSILYQKLI